MKIGMRKRFAALASTVALAVAMLVSAPAAQATARGTCTPNANLWADNYGYYAYGSVSCVAAKNPTIRTYFAYQQYGKWTVIYDKTISVASNGYSRTPTAWTAWGGAYRYHVHVTACWSSSSGTRVCRVDSANRYP